MMFLKDTSNISVTLQVNQDKNGDCQAYTVSPYLIHNTTQDFCLVARRHLEISDFSASAVAAISPSIARWTFRLSPSLFISKWEIEIAWLIQFSIQTLVSLTAKVDVQSRGIFPVIHAWKLNSVKVPTGFIWSKSSRILARLSLFTKRSICFGLETVKLRK